MAVACGPSFWVSDEERERCQSCAGAFGLFLRRHHCRRCGEIFCDPCSAATAPLHSLDGRDLGAQRVCAACLDQLTHAAAPRRAPQTSSRDTDRPRKSKRERKERKAKDRASRTEEWAGDRPAAAQLTDASVEPEPEPEVEPVAEPDDDDDPEEEPDGLKALEYFGRESGAALPQREGWDIVIHADGSVQERVEAAPPAVPKSGVRAIRLSPEHRLLLELVRQIGAPGFHGIMTTAYLSEASSASLDLGASVALLGQLAEMLGGLDAAQQPLALRGVTLLLAEALAMPRPSLDLEPWLYSLGFDQDFCEVFQVGLIKVVQSNSIGGALGAMAAGADGSVAVLDDRLIGKLTSHLHSETFQADFGEVACGFS